MEVKHRITPALSAFHSEWDFVVKQNKIKQNE